MAAGLRQAGVEGGGKKMSSWMTEPRYRTTGIVITLKLEYLADDGKSAGKVYVDGSSDITCFITAEITGGWQPFGSIISYHDRANYTNRQDFPKYESGTGEVERVSFTDRYERGLTINFEALGEVGEFDLMNLVVWFTQLTVLLAFCPLAVSVVAFNMIGYKSKVYMAKVRVCRRCAGSPWTSPPFFTHTCPPLLLPMVAGEGEGRRATRARQGCSERARSQHELQNF